ncbi:SCO3242 family prenyltransferase [Streptomyces sp. NPDC054863]
MTNPPGADVRAWLELLRVSALLTVPGDALAGAAALSVRPNRGTALALASSLCLYEAGMALNDWADRAEDAQDRPHRPIPSGRITPSAALSAACTLSAAGLFLASRAGRPALAAATAVTATVWAYDLKLKHTALGPATMATARALDLLMGAVATGAAAPGATPPEASVASPGATRAEAAVAGSAGRSPSRPATRGPGPSRRGTAGTWHLPWGLADALSAATVLGAHTYGVTELSRHEVQGGSTTAPLTALGAAATIAAVLPRRPGDGAGLGGSDRGGMRPGAARRGGARLDGARQASVRESAGGGGGGVRQGAVRRGPVRQAVVRRGVVRPGAVREGAGGWDPVRQEAFRRGAVRQGVVPGVAASGRGVASGRILVCALAAAYLRTVGRPLLHAALNPSPPLTQRAVGGGIRAMIPLQAALAARSGAPGAGVALLVLAPLARRLARKVSPT